MRATVGSKLGLVLLRATAQAIHGSVDNSKQSNRFTGQPCKVQVNLFSISDKGCAGNWSYDGDKSYRCLYLVLDYETSVRIINSVAKQRKGRVTSA